MHTNVQKIINFNYRDNIFDILYLITDHQGCPPILPLMFTTYLSRFGVIYESQEITDALTGRRMQCLIRREVSDSTIRAYVYCLAKFLSYLETCKEIHKTPGLHSSSSCNEKFVNEYLNDHLPKTLKTQQSLQSHQSALTAYYNWHDYFEITPRLNLKILRKTRQSIAEHCGKQNYIQFVSRYWRAQLLSSCETQCEKLMMRMGFEVGLRTSEVSALRRKGREKLEDLFNQLDDQKFNQRESFRYLLEGIFTKNGKSRYIYFDRELLQDMKRYFDTERTWILRKIEKDPNEFFLKTSPKDFGSPIGVEQASRVFRKRARQAGLNTLLSFHDLRHTFATQLFHEQVVELSGKETRVDSPTLIYVAERLGHTLTRNGQAPSTTVRYIRMRLQLIELDITES